jgi:hypothetical protein
VTEPVEVEYTTYHGGLSFSPNPEFGRLVFQDTVIALKGINIGSTLQTKLELRALAVASIEVTSEQVAKSRVGATFLFGVLGLGAKHTWDRTTIIVHMKSGEVGYFTVADRSAPGVRGDITPWMRERNIPLGTPAPAPVQIASIADELAKLAQLREKGVLTDEEFVAQKARLLAN